MAKKNEETNLLVDAKIQEDTDVSVTVMLPHMPDGGVVRYIAAAPPTDTRSTEGYALPFHDEDQAFYMTPNSGEACVVTTVDDKGYKGHKVSMTLPRMPNSYYRDMGSCLVPPSVHLRYLHATQTRAFTVRLTDNVPFRSLVAGAPRFPPVRRLDKTVFCVEAPIVRSQEEILRSAEHPATRFG